MFFSPNSLLSFLWMLFMMLVPLLVLGLVVYYASSAGTRRALLEIQANRGKDDRLDEHQQGQEGK
ncbi:MAG: hypothetical protein ACOYU7_04240 [Bacillota bacterium]